MGRLLGMIEKTGLTLVCCCQLPTFWYPKLPRSKGSQGRGKMGARGEGEAEGAKDIVDKRSL